jgi:hypothetical protein
VKLRSDRKRPTPEVIDDLRKQIASAEPSLDPIEFPGILADLVGDLI